jgi:hypothetical protein
MTYINSHNESVGHYPCLEGIHYKSNLSNSTHEFWICSGTNGDPDATNCSRPITWLSNGKCPTNTPIENWIFTCKQGIVSINYSKILNGTRYLWQCLAPDGSPSGTDNCSARCVDCPRDQLNSTVPIDGLCNKNNLTKYGDKPFGWEPCFKGIYLPSSHKIINSTHEFWTCMGIRGASVNCTSQYSKIVIADNGECDARINILGCNKGKLQFTNVTTYPNGTTASVTDSRMPIGKNMTHFIWQCVGEVTTAECSRSIKDYEKYIETHNQDYINNQTQQQIQALQEQISQLDNSCTGCKAGETCYPVGYRKNNTYCSSTLSFAGQLGEDSPCENNFECTSNICASNKCLNPAFWDRISAWFKNLFGTE